MSIEALLLQIEVEMVVGMVVVVEVVLINVGLT